MTAGRTAPLAHDEPPLPRRLSLALGSGTILQGLNSAVIAVALVSIAAHFGDDGAIPWLVSGLYIAAAVGSPAGGRLADLFGPRRVYLAGLVVVLLASVAGPFMPSAEALAIDRVVLGLGTSMQFPAAMAIIRGQAAAQRRSAVGALGVIAICGQTTAALGPTLGGAVVVLFGWQGIFWVNLPIVLLAALWVGLGVPADPPAPKRGGRAVLRRLDPLGIVLFVATIVLLMLALLSLRDAPQWWLLAAVAPVTGLFVAWELRSATPFVDVRLLSANPGFAATCLRAVATFVSFYCIFYGLPQWLEASAGLGPAGAGLLMLPVFGVGVLSTVIATGLGRRLRPRTLLLVGTSGMVVAGALLALFVTPSSPIWLLVVVAALLGLPNGFNNMGNQLLLHAGVPAASAGVASGIYRTAQYVGASLSAVIVAHALGAGGRGGIDELGWWIAALGAGLLLVNLIAIARRRPQSSSPTDPPAGGGTEPAS